jgi:hypothetical protein
LGLLLIAVKVDDCPEHNAGGFAVMVAGGAGTTVATVGVRGPSQPVSYVISKREMDPPASCQICCGNVVANGNCIPIRVIVTVVPFMVVVAGEGA